MVFGHFFIVYDVEHFQLVTTFVHWAVNINNSIQMDGNC